MTPLPPGASTGVGSLPGTDVDEAARLSFGECPALPFLPELPARGPGAELVGRGAALLAGMHVDLQPAGWRLVDRGGLDERRARGLLARDLDALEEQAQGYAGPLKIAAAGPWTLAATLELPRGGPALADPGACRDLAAALAEGLAGHAAEVARRVPGATLLVQLDEPALPAVLGGRVPTPSGFRTLRAVYPPAVLDGLRAVLGASAGVRAAGGGAPLPLLHCCAEGVPVRLALDAGFRGLSLDLTRLAAAQEDELGTAAEAGHVLLLGVVPTVPGPDARGLSDPSSTVTRVRTLWHRLGLPPELLRQVALTPGCGLAAASPGYARAALQHCREAARRLAEVG